MTQRVIECQTCLALIRWWTKAARKGDTDPLSPRRRIELVAAAGSAAAA
jgi:hypothetical protein